MLSFFPRGVLDEILNLIESVSEGFPSYSYIPCYFFIWKLCPIYIFHLVEDISTKLCINRQLHLQTKRIITISITD